MGKGRGIVVRELVVVVLVFVVVVSHDGVGSAGCSFVFWAKARNRYTCSI